MTYLPRYQPRAQEPIRIAPRRPHVMDWNPLGTLLVAIGMWWIILWLVTHGI